MILLSRLCWLVALLVEFVSKAKFLCCYSILQYKTRSISFNSIGHAYEPPLSELHVREIAFWTNQFGEKCNRNLNLCWRHWHFSWCSQPDMLWGRQRGSSPENGGVTLLQIECQYKAPHDTILEFAPVLPRLFPFLQDEILSPASSSYS